MSPGPEQGLYNLVIAFLSIGVPERQYIADGAPPRGTTHHRVQCHSWPECGYA